MKIIKRENSKLDSTVKFVIELDDGLIAEVSYIDKGDGKSIYCMPSSTGCNMGCTFCHSTAFSNKVWNRPLQDNEIFTMYRLAVDAIGFMHSTLLISYMGMGDPMSNITNVLRSMSMIKEDGSKMANVVRFALCSMFPMKDYSVAFDKLVDHMYLSLLDIKLHASIHGLGDRRRNMMPSANPESGVLDMLDLYMYVTLREVEIHYALIEGVNDSQEDIDALGLEIIKYIHRSRYSQFTVKFLQYNENADGGFKKSKDQSGILKYAQSILPVTCELYSPPGQDIGASCGQFNSEMYLKYNSKEE